jgi:hypothetical protein
VIFVAHGIGGVRDLPVPAWLFFWGAAIVLVVSFVLLGALWKRPLLDRLAAGRPAPAWLSRVVLSRALRVALQLVSAGLFVLVFAAALVGDTDPFRNLAPTWIYVIFWLGLPALSVLLGDVWRVLSPWRALADGAVWAWELTGRRARPLSAFPEQFGRWPAAVLLFAFAALELAYSDPSSPRALAFAVALYTYVTLFGFAAFGRETWSERGEAFAVLFSYFARISAFAVRDGRLLLRWPLSGLAGAELVPGSVAFLAVMLGTVGFDGFSRSSQWQNLLSDLEGPYVLENPDLADLIVSGVNLLGMLGFVVLVGAAYALACAAARSIVDAPRSLVPDFLLGLVPIAFVYVVAHYFSLFVIQGQFAIPLLSDPFGKGWDLLGTAGFTPNLAPFSPNTVWYVQVAALVAGHVAGLAIAHDRAVAIFRDRGAALRSQYAMLALMVLYTVGGLWLLSRG